MGHEQLVVLVDRYKVAIEQPMDSRRKGEAVLDDVEAAGGDWPDMRDLYLCPATTVMILTP